MPDKSKFVSELMRVVAPGGRILIVTWCHRDLEPGEPSLSKKEEKILAKINRAYYLPKWCSVDDYVKLLEKEGGGRYQTRGLVIHYCALLESCYKIIIKLEECCRVIEEWLFNN